MLQHKLNLSGWLVFGTKILKDFLSIYTYIKFVPVIVAPPYTRGHDLNKFESTLSEISLSFCCKRVFERKILKGLLFLLWGCFQANFNSSNQTVFEKTIFWKTPTKFIYIFLSPPKRERGPSFKKTEFPSPNDALCEVCLKFE